MTEVLCGRQTDMTVRKAGDRQFELFIFHKETKQGHEKWKNEVTESLRKTNPTQRLERWGRKKGMWRANRRSSCQRKVMERCRGEGGGSMTDAGMKERRKRSMYEEYWQEGWKSEGGKRSILGKEMLERKKGWWKKGCWQDCMVERRAWSKNGYGKMKHDWKRHVGKIGGSWTRDGKKIEGGWMRDVAKIEDVWKRNVGNKGGG